MVTESPEIGLVRLRAHDFTMTAASTMRLRTMRHITSLNDLKTLRAGAARRHSGTDSRRALMHRPAAALRGTALKSLRHIAFSTGGGFASGVAKFARDALLGRAIARWAKRPYFTGFFARAGRRGGSARYPCGGEPFPYSRYAAAPWHFLNFRPLPQGQSSLRPTFG